MRKTLVILVGGLSPSLIGEHTPHLVALAKRGAMRPLQSVTPALSCVAQSSMVTGLAPAEHGVVGNGWYFRDRAETAMWQQSNRLVSGEKIWEAGKRRDPAFSCAKMFWCYNMYSTADWSATPRAFSPADGHEIPGHYTQPAELHDELKKQFGQFPQAQFWGPDANIESSRWIADATRYVMQTRNPTLTLTYLPHLDFNLQRLGPDLSSPVLQADLKAVDELCGFLIAEAGNTDHEVLVVSEYAVTPVSDAIHINRSLRAAGLLSVRNEQGSEQLDAGASDAFAVADHQIAHVYVNNTDRLDEVKTLLETLDGVGEVLDDAGKASVGLDHERAGDLIAIAKADRWFSYYFWLDDSRAPDYSRTVDIHRKPGFDPVELFIDPDIRMPGLEVGRCKLRRKLGYRSLLNVISNHETTLVKGSFGRPSDDPQNGPVIISSKESALPASVTHADVKALVLKHIFG